MSKTEFEVKIRIRLNDDSDIQYWSKKESLMSLISDLGHKFDISSEYINVEIKEIPNFKEIYKFLVEYVKDLNL